MTAVVHTYSRLMFCTNNIETHKSTYHYFYCSKYVFHLIILQLVMNTKKKLMGKDGKYVEYVFDKNNGQLFMVRKTLFAKAVFDMFCVQSLMLIT